MSLGASMQACKEEPATEAYYGADSADAQVPPPSPTSPAEATQVDQYPDSVSEAAKLPESLQATQFDSPGMPAGPQEPAGDMQQDDDEDDGEDDEDFAVKSLPPPPLSKDAVYHKMRRIMQPRADGSYLVAPEFREQYKDKHNGRPKLEAMFEKAGYNPDPCIGIVLEMLVQSIDALSPMPQLNPKPCRGSLCQEV